MRNYWEESYQLLATEDNSKIQQTAIEDTQKPILWPDHISKAQAKSFQ